MTMGIQDEARRLSSLRMQMLEMHPFWGYLLMQVRFVPQEDLPTFAATDCIRHIWYNPELTRHLSTPMLGFVLAHEVGHQVFASLGRQRGRNQHLWTCATDFAINRIVASIPHPARPREKLYQPPSGKLPGLGEIAVLLDLKYSGMVAEVIYEHLLADAVPDTRQVSVTLDLGEAGEVTLPNLSDHGGGIDVHLPDTLTPAQRDEIGARVAAAVETFQRSNKAGHIPGHLVRRLEENRRPQVPWHRVLRSFAGQALARDQYSLSRPNRRYLEQDIVVPGLHSEKAGCLVVAVDTSASMTEEQLAQIGAELDALAPQCEQFVLIVADAEIQEVIREGEIASYLKRRRFKGGGGTDHRPVFEYIDEQRIHPDLFVGLTDLYTCLPRKKPPYPVLWVVPEEHGDALWGRVIRFT